MRTAILATIFASILLLFAPSAVLACSCAERPTQDKEFNSSESVFIGRIVDSTAPTPREEVLGRDPGLTVVVIEKVYKGDLKVGDRFTISNGDGVNCAYTFGQMSVGQTWLLYLRKPYPRSVFDLSSGKWKATGEMTTHVSFCGRSGQIDRSSHDLAYLDNLERYRGKNRLSGRLMEAGRDVPNVAGMRIKIIGKQKSFTTRVLESGYFEIYDLPRGEYTVDFDAPSGWKLGDYYHSEFTTYPNRFDDEGLGKNRRRVSIGDEHYGLDFSFVHDTRAAGQILSAEGVPLERVCISAVPIDLSPDQYVVSACSARDGSFDFEQIRPGAYHLVANRDGKISEKEPFGTILYPGVLKRSDAGVVVIEPGRYLTKLDIQIPQMIPLMEVSGRVLYADNKPADRSSVRFIPADRESYAEVEAHSESDGSFAIKVPFGAAGEIIAERYFWDHSYSCPQIVAAREAEKTDKLNTSTLAVTGKESLYSVQLKFPFDFCKEN
ncbi:MAG: hypothetical protein IPM21_01400 [Acidobacteria bacterium]|nr:hypothetical protein [Acidobacteriota bacterium]